MISSGNIDWLKIYEIKDDEIYVFQINIQELSNDISEYEQFLSIDEREKAKKFHFDKDRIVYTVVRATLKILLAKLLKLAPNQLSFFYNEYGKPYLEKRLNSNIYFNVSHSKNYGIIAINLNHEVGVDIELINEDFVARDIVKKYFSITILPLHLFL